MIKHEISSTVDDKVNISDIIRNTPTIKTHVAHPLTKVTAKADTGACQHYFKTNDTGVIKNIQQNYFAPSIKLSDSTTTQQKLKL